MKRLMIRAVSALLFVCSGVSFAQIVNPVFIQSGSGAVPRTHLAKAVDVVQVKDYNAKCDDSTDDTAAIQAALNALIARGGGKLQFPPGATCRLVTRTRVTGNFGGSGSYVDAHLRIQNAAGIEIEGRGAKLKSTATDGGTILLLDGVRDVSISDLAIESPFAFAGDGYTVSVVGVNGFMLASLTRDAERIQLKNIKATNIYGAVVTGGNPLKAFRVRQVLIENLFHDTGRYGVQNGDDGDLFTVSSLRTKNVSRGYFVYGVDRHTVTMTSEGGKNMNPVLIKAYSRDTSNIDLSARIAGRCSVGDPIGGMVSIQSDHPVAKQPTPKRVYNVRLHMDDNGSFASDCVHTSFYSLGFGYFRDGVSTATASTTIFDNITISGAAASEVKCAVAQTPAGRANFSGLKMDASSIKVSGLYAQCGFVKP